MNETDNEVLISVQDLRKQYGDILALDDISFEARRGDVLGFLGPNGAGKTTAMKIITGFLEADAGRVEVAGHDIAAEPLGSRRRIGYLPENAPAYGEMTVDGFLRFVAAARKVDAESCLPRALELTELHDVRFQTIETLSKGFKRRVGLAQALLHDPEILILDEPTDGLDPNQKALVQSLLGQLAEGRCIILSTHILDEAEKICNRAVIISQGTIRADSTPRQLMEASPTHNTIRMTVAEGQIDRVAERVSGLPWCRELQRHSSSIIDIVPHGGENHLADLPRLLAGIEVLSMHTREGRLEDSFRELTQGVAA